jgi:hypothetical protein
MNERDKNEYHTYIRGNRKAKVILTVEGWQVDCYENSQLLKTIYAPDKNEEYAERIGNNWVDEIID